MTAARIWLVAGVLFAPALAAPALAAPAAAQDKTDPAPKSAEKRYSFSMQNVPWPKVLEWVVDQSGLPLVAQSLPSGTFTFTPPRVDGKAVTYTLTEIIDAVNEGLMTKGVLLVRRTRSLTLVPADARLDPMLVPHVKVDDLASRGRTELVRVVLTMRTLNANDMAPEVKKLLGPFGEVTVIGNRLIVTDTAATIRQLISILRETDGREGPAETTGNVRTITLEQGNAAVLAEELERLLKLLRGKKNPVRVVLPGREQPQPAKMPGKAPVKIPEPPANTVTITAVGNRLIITSDDAEALAAANELVRLITQAVRSGPEIIPLRNAPAVSVAKLLDETFNGRGQGKNERIRVVADAASNSLLVQANALDMITIRRLLEKALDAPVAETTARTRLIGPLRNATAADVVKVVRQIYTNDNLVIAADAKTNVVVLRCPDNVYHDIEALVKLLDTKQE
jgi:type II secretory pathway component GspD/PulD (secretin)